MAVPKNALRAGMDKKLENRTDLATTGLNVLLGGKANGREVVEVEIDLLDAHPEQDCFSMDEAELEWLANNVAEVGVRVPLNLVPKAGGRYTILAGHRRKAAAQRAGLSTVPAIIEDVTEDMATAIFYATNIGQRHALRPSEKARGYLRIEKSLESAGAKNGRTTAAIADVTGDNVKQIYRYKRLNQLNSELLALVDTGTIPFCAGVDISYLPSAAQDNLVTLIEDGVINTITTKQAAILRELCAASGLVTISDIRSCLIPNKKEKRNTTNVLKLKRERFKGFFDEDTSDKEIEEIIVTALKKHFGIT